MGVCVSQLRKGAQGLEYTSGNESILNEILEEIDDVVAKRPSESSVGFVSLASALALQRSR